MTSVFLRGQLPSRMLYLCLAVVMIAPIPLFVLWLTKYPYFSPFVTSDMIQHPELAQAALGGTLPLQLFYYGGDWLVAALSTATGLSTLTTTEAVLLATEPILALSVYWAASSVTQKREYGLVCAAVFTVTGGIWYVMDVNVGLLDNSVALIADCLILGCYSRLLSSWDARWSCALALSCAAGLFTHYTVVTVFPAMIVYPLFLKGAERRRATEVGFWVLFWGVVVAAFRPTAVAALSSVFYQDSPPIQLASSVAPLLSWSPFFLNLFALMQDDLAMLVLGAAFLLLAYHIVRRRGRSARPVLLIILWFIPVFAIGNYSAGLWRYALEGSLPFLMLACWPITTYVFPDASKARWNRISHEVRVQRMGALSFFLAVAVLASPIVGMAQLASTQTSLVGHEQQQVYDSMLWMKASLPPRSVVLSTTDSDYWFLSDVAGSTGTFNRSVISTSSLTDQQRLPTYLAQTTFYPNGAPAVTETYDGVQIVVGNFTGLEPVMYKEQGVTVFRLDYWPGGGGSSGVRIPL